MALTLYAAVVPSYLQILESMARLVSKAQDFCQDRGLEPVAILDARLADDMLPFAYQIKSTAVHSIGAIEGVRRGVFSPDRASPPKTFAGLAERVAEAIPNWKPWIRVSWKASSDGICGSSSVTITWISRPRISFSPSPNPISISTPPRPTTSCG